MEVSAETASLASKTTTRFICSHPMTPSTHSVRHSKPLTFTLPRALVHQVHAFDLIFFPCLSFGKQLINNLYARAASIFKHLNFQSPFNFPFCLLSFGLVDSELKPGHRDGHHLPHAIRFLIIRPCNRLEVLSFSNSNVQAIAFAFAKFNTSMALNDRSPNFKKVSKLQLNYLPSPISLF